MNRKDPYRYFRVEARELADALGKDALELDRSGTSGEAVARLLRNAHTLKGASRVVRLPAIGELAHAIEEALSPYREGNANTSVPREVPDRILSLLDGLPALLAGLDAPAEAPPASPGQSLAAASEGPSPGARKWDTVRLEIAEVDGVLERMSEATAQLAVLRREMEGLDRIRRLSGSLTERAGGGTLKRLAAAEELNAWLERFQRVSGEALDQAERDMRQAHERTERLRLIPAAALFDFLERAVRDAARTLGKEVRFEAVGGAQRLDAPVLSSLQEALLHVVRNAVAHGIEEPAARLRAGKSAAGLVRLEASRRGGRVVFSCKDDGRGIDPAEVRGLAAARGLLPSPAPDALDLQAAVRLLLKGGISSAAAVSELSGRGIGLDVVRETVEGLGGGIRVESRIGGGTAVELEVPYSLSTFPALAVEVEGSQVLIPFENVLRAVRVLDTDLARSPEGSTMVFEGRALPVLPLESVLMRGGTEKPRHARPGVVVESASGVALLGADRILGVRETVARPLPSLAVSDPVVAGAGLDVEGHPCLVLDPDGLVRAAHGRKGGEAPPAPAAKPVILVVDDSLTTRMLEQSILESAGYPVECAVSAEEALEMVKRKRYGLFLVDVEMPGMDGFTLLERFRDDAVLRDIPAILVTSRDSREDRRRAEAAGARDHIVKGEFDQARLLGRIRELMG